MNALPQLPVAILAGGLATRLRPVTDKIPKSLVPVAGRPFLAHQLDMLRSRGTRRAVLCVGHLGAMIEREFGNGKSFGMQLDYAYDGPALLGTGGAIQHALPLLGDSFFVLYGDSYLPVDYLPIAECFRRSGKLGCMTVFRNEGKYDSSNVVFRNHQIVAYDKTARLPEMRHIDYGLSAFQDSAFDDFPVNEPFDLAQVLQKLIAAGQLAGCEVSERFYEIGSPAGLADLESLLNHRQVRISSTQDTCKGDRA